MKNIKAYDDFINENVKQLELFEVPEHIHLINALYKFNDDLNFKKHFKSDTNYKGYLTAHLDDALSLLKRSINELNPSEYIYPFAKEFPVEEFPEYYNKEWFDDKDIDFTTDSLLSNLDYADPDAFDIVSKEGSEDLDKSIITTVEELLDELYYALSDIDENGLNIYRAVSLKNDSSDKSLYDKITTNYNGVGLYWTYDENLPESYNGYRGTEYVFYGKVRLQDINWTNTIFKQLYNLREEKEIEVKHDAIIKIEKIRTGDKFLPLKHALYIEAE